MKKSAAVILGFALLGPTSSTAQADVIFETLPPAQGFVFFADRDYLFTEAAFPFSLLSGASTVTDAHWWGGCYEPATIEPGSPASGSGTNDCPDGDFVLSFYENGVGEPGALIQSFDVDTANQSATGESIGIGDFITEYSYSADFGPLVLIPGETYWFAISNLVDGTTWGWESFGGEETHAQFNSTTDLWESHIDGLAFRLTGPGPAAVPEPGLLSLLAAGVGGIALSRARRHRRVKPSSDDRTPVP
jgi:hypothetical protein